MKKIYVIGLFLCVITHLQGMNFFYNKPVGPKQEKQKLRMLDGQQQTTVQPSMSIDESSPREGSRIDEHITLVSQKLQESDNAHQAAIEQRTKEELIKMFTLKEHHYKKIMRDQSAKIGILERKLQALGESFHIQNMQLEAAYSRCSGIDITLQEAQKELNALKKKNNRVVFPSEPLPTLHPATRTVIPERSYTDVEIEPTRRPKPLPAFMPPPENNESPAHCVVQ